MSDKYIRISFSGRLSETQESELRSNGVALSTSNSLLGGEALTEIIAIISTPYVLSHLKEIVIELIKNRRKVRIKTKDFELNDVSEAQILMLTDRLQAKTKISHAPVTSPSEKASRKRQPKRDA